ncbi:echinoderm microtubule-associated protein-like 2 isoform X3 [Anthonomus grandis grandis]|uniref:echinoderm microtubule-associated protein-like 2 isoform X3 n=1 Tax=Anthonomus grandis grandis TaxID=2921223 RepID=UPI00216515E6|nr:echinoderm microtubule-associated protein-like 2 isoform X3 [Anthonomus grandis grandis]
MSESADELSKSEDISLLLNRSYQDGDSPNFNETYNAWHEMLETENRGMAGRMADLERKVLEQGDELVCLKATLAEVLRRLSLIEGMRNSSSATSSLSTPVRINGSGSYKDLRKQMSYSTSKVETANRKFSGSSLPQRRAVHYQSTGSLHSDSHSSSSVSPIPSPSPRATPLPLNGRRPISVTSTSSSNTITSTNTLHKRWSSTGDFNQTGATGMQSKFSTKSFLNLFKSNNSPNSPNYKHGTKEATYNEEEKSLKMFLRGRPIILYAPTELSENYEVTKVNTAPVQRLKLDWAYGYRGRDCRSNLYFLPTGEMVYFVASVVVLYNVEEQNQRHYVEHTDDIKSLAIHPNKMLVATGQSSGQEKINGRAHIRVWNSVSLHTQAVIGLNHFELAVCCLSFSKADGGSLLVAVDEAADHTISVWEWQRGENGHRITETKCSVDTIVSAEFHPLDRNTIVTCGKSHIAFWSLDVNGTLFKRMGIFETRDKPKYVTCCAFLQTGETITGDSNGNLEIWGRGTNTIWKMIKNVHEGGIFSICVLKDGSVITGGGKDSRIVKFDCNLGKTGVVSQIERHYGGVRVISEGPGSQLLLGTTRNCVLNGTPEMGFQPIILGHSDDLWGLAPHPSIPQFATAGYDRVLQLWDSMSHSILWSKDIGEQAQSVTFSQDGAVILVGCVNGKWMIFDTQTRELLGYHTDGNEPIQVISFAPDGNMVALGSRDNHIYIYQVSEDGMKYSRVGRCTGHSSFITHLDWANDNQTLRSNSGDYELLFWNAGTCRQIPQSTLMRDVDWATNTCTLTFSTVGIWPENADGTDVNACDRSHDKKLLATADDYGKVKLFSYPASQPKSLCHTYGGHAAHVTSVTFLHDDTRLVSIGGRDTAVLQWIVS